MNHVRTFFKALGVCVLLYLLFNHIFYRGEYISDQAIRTVGSIIIVLLCYIIALMHQLIDIGEKKADETSRSNEEENKNGTSLSSRKEDAENEFKGD